MGTLTWNGSIFDESIFEPSQFLTDAGGYLFYYDQNYNGFFPAVVDPNSGIPHYASNGYGTQTDGNTFSINFPNIMLQFPSLNQYAGSFGAEVVLKRKLTFFADPTNILQTVLQDPTTLVNTALNQAIASNVGLQTALASATSILTDVNLNFILKDTVAGWLGGADTIKSIQNIINDHAASLHGVQDSIMRVADFKKKLIKQATTQADKVVRLQDEINKFQTAGTFNALASAFPTQFNKLQAVFDSHNSFLQTEATKYLPSSVKNAIVSSAFNKIFGGAIGQIANPLDKILSDLNTIDQKALSSIQNFPSGKFASIADQTSYVNQLSNILDGITSKLPTVPSIIGSNVITDSQQIVNQILNYNKGLFGRGTPISPTVTTAVSASNATAFPPNSDPTTIAGSLKLDPALIAYIPKDDYLTLPLPKIVSPDPQIANNKQKIDQQNTNNSEASAQRNVKRGDCVNNIGDVPLKPRTQPLDGSQGSYLGSKPIPF